MNITNYFASMFFKDVLKCIGGKNLHSKKPLTDYIKKCYYKLKGIWELKTVGSL